MGLELAHAMPSAERIDFLEIQGEFRMHFASNRGARSPDAFRFLEMPWSKLAEEPLRSRYDVVISNPPYFLENEGSLGPSTLSNRCRFFLDDSFDGYVRAVRSALRPGGRAYLLAKTEERQGRDRLALLRTILWDCEVQTLADVRGTDLLKITAAG